MDIKEQTLSELNITDADMTLLIPAKYVCIFLTMLARQTNPDSLITEDGLLEFCYKNNLIDGETRLFSVTVNKNKLSFWSHKSMSVWTVAGNPISVSEVITTIAAML